MNPSDYKTTVVHDYHAKKYQTANLIVLLVIALVVIFLGSLPSKRVVTETFEGSFIYRNGEYYCPNNGEKLTAIETKDGWDSLSAEEIIRKCYSITSN